VNTEAKIAHGWLHTARFLTTAPQLEHLPALDLPEIAFVGRSNAGKSTCINTLTQQKRLAFASKTPGRTQSINLFSLGKQGVHDAVLADLPGYGYAAVPREAKLRWQRVMGNYLITRKNLKAVVLLCDPRLGLTEIDEILLEVIRPRVEQGMKFLILLTKADKLTRQQQADILREVREGVASLGEQCSVQLFSSLKKTGIEQAEQVLSRWLDLQPAEAVEKPPAKRVLAPGEKRNPELAARLAARKAAKAAKVSQSAARQPDKKKAPGKGGTGG
jgi:GTP-binding protein